MHLLPRLAAALGVATILAAQGTSTPATDVGITLDGGLLTVLYGQNCGAFSCTPLYGGPIAAGQPRQVAVYGDAGQLFVLAAALQPATAPCTNVPGLANALLLQQPVVLALGVTTAWPASCPAGRAVCPLVFPPGVPSGVQFTLQGLAASAAQGHFAFTVGLRCWTP